jgi:signal transduction histidine kinase
MRPARLTLLATAAASFATFFVTFAPWMRFGYQSPEAHASLETAAVLIAFVTAVLVTGRFRARGRADDLVLASALFALSTANLFFATVPDLLGRDAEPAWVWSAVVARLGAGAIFAAAAFTPARRLRFGAEALVVPFAATLFLIAVSSAIGFGLLDDVPLGIAPSLSPETAARPYLVGHPLLLGTQLASALGFGLAAIGFLRKSRIDAFAGWLAAASVLGAFARVNYFLFPSIYSDWFYTGDLLRLAFYVCLLTAAVQEIRAHWHGLAQAAVLDERRRLARDLHDGVAQELAFIRTQAATETVVHAAERALDESRRAIAALTLRPDEPLHLVLARVAEDVAARAGGRVTLDLDERAEATPELREALVRIMSEAITNALRHGGTDAVSVRLGSDPLTLRIDDRGRGFDPAQPAVRGFGLTSMRERAAQVGARLSISSKQGAGTRLEVVVP